MNNKYYYKVIGKVENSEGKIEYYRLGYTTSKTAWLKNSNGWEEKDLIFSRQIVGKSSRHEWLNK